jgi:hypothetical protein
VARTFKLSDGYVNGSTKIEFAYGGAEGNPRVHPEGRMIDGRMIFQQIRPEQLEYRYNGDESYVPKTGGATLAYSRDGSRLAVGGHGKVILFDMRANRELRQFDTATLPLLPTAAVAVSADNKRVMAMDRSGTLTVWDAETGELIKRKTSDRVADLNSDSAVFSPDATRIAFITKAYNVEVWEVASGESAALVVYTPDQWAAVATGGGSWNTSQLGRRYAGYVNDDGLIETVSEPSGNPELLQAILTGKSDEGILARLAAEREAAQVGVREARQAARALQPLMKGYYRFNPWLIAEKEGGGEAVGVRYIYSDGWLLVINIVGTPNVTSGTLRNLDRPEKYMVSQRAEVIEKNERNLELYFDSRDWGLGRQGMVGRRFSLTLEGPGGKWVVPEFDL